MTYRTAGLAPALELFVAVGETGSVTAAAVRLGIPQPTVSRTVARLSRELGVELLVRDGRGVRLTRQGALLAAHGGRALRELGVGVDAVRTDSDAERGHVVLGFLHSMGARAVPDLLRGFVRDHPEMTIGLVQDASDVVVDGVLGGTIDLALASPVPQRSDLRTRALARQPLVAVLPATHRLAARRWIRPGDLAGEKLITMRRGYGVRTLTDQILRDAGVALDYDFESDEMTTIAGLVSVGLGVSLLPLGAAAGASVAQVALRAPDAARVVSLTWSARRTLTPPVQALRRHLLADGPAALAPPDEAVSASG